MSKATKSRMESKSKTNAKVLQDFKVDANKVNAKGLQLFNVDAEGFATLQSRCQRIATLFFHILFNYNARDNANKRITIYYVVWTRLTRVGCFNWLAHYKRMRIADKNNVHCTF